MMLIKYEKKKKSPALINHVIRNSNGGFKHSDRQTLFDLVHVLVRTMID